ncbi:MAG: sigma factor G inhibitor Gin [Firmicutes bacterium]|nr:sigma factor G inhibitor Gin [Bacillota bacterium]
MTDRIFDCFVCLKPRRRGVMVAGRFLCDRCQQEMVDSRPGVPRYELFLRRTAAFWRSLKEAAAAKE